jgi:hypothetical protein
MGKIGLTELIFILFIIVPAILQIMWFFSSLKKEKEGYIQITQAAQELNNQTLHKAGENLFKSNRLKYFIVTLALIQIAISIFITSIALS